MAATPLSYKSPSTHRPTRPRALSGIICLTSLGGAALIWLMGQLLVDRLLFSRYGFVLVGMMILFWSLLAVGAASAIIFIVRFLAARRGG
jgi:hypothetical protein